MHQFPYTFDSTSLFSTNFSNPQFMLKVQTIQDEFFDLDFPVFKHQKLENCDAAHILDPDLFFKKEEEFNDEELSVGYQTTEISSLGVSPGRDCRFSSFSDLLSPDQSPLDFDRKSSFLYKLEEVDNEDENEREHISSKVQENQQEEITSHRQLLEVVKKTLSCDNTNLLMAVEKVLQGGINNATELDGLTSVEECIVNAIIQKKEFSHQNKKQKGKKREEEKQKFFFKGLLKYTEAKFFGNDCGQKKRTKKKQLKKDAYYEYYWAEVAKENNIDLSNFFHPNKKLASGKTTAQISSAQNPGLKSLNTTYIDLILSSDKFKVDTLDYLDGVFLQEVRSARSQKILKLLSKLNGLATEAVNKAYLLPVDQQVEVMKSKVYDYLVVNPKSKLPWGDSELQEARDFAYTTILRQSSKTTKLF